MNGNIPYVPIFIVSSEKTSNIGNPLSSFTDIKDPDILSTTSNSTPLVPSIFIKDAPETSENICNDVELGTIPTPREAPLPVIKNGPDRLAVIVDPVATIKFSIESECTISPCFTLNSFDILFPLFHYPKSELLYCNIVI
jgi:hypothetical protein